MSEPESEGGSPKPASVQVANSQNNGHQQVPKMEREAVQVETIRSLTRGSHVYFNILLLCGTHSCQTATGE